MVSSARPYYIAKIKSELERRQKKNSSYSLRSFAKDLEVDSSTLSSILREKRRPSLKLARELAVKLCDNSQEVDRFIQSAKPSGRLKNLLNVPSGEEEMVLRSGSAQVVTEWEHYAVLSLSQVMGFSADPKWVAERLGISANRAEQVLKNLEIADVIYWDKDQKLNIKDEPNGFSVAASDPESLRQATRNSIAIALEKLDAVPHNERYFSSNTFPMPYARLEEAVEIIREFRQRFEKLISSGTKDCVYKFNMQFFPLTPKRGQD
jgi:uncharacterized protein (TIGR02147 family)